MDYVLTVRDKSGDGFGEEPSATRYLIVPDGEIPKPAHAEGARIKWAKQVIEAADPAKTGQGHILFFIHGYNNSPQSVIATHRALKLDVGSLGFNGVVVSFDWPSGDSVLGYIEDRVDAKITALRLVTDGIKLLAAFQTPECHVNFHVLAHSMGAFVAREAFDDADDRNFQGHDWMVNQMMLIGGDVSSKSLAAGNPDSASLYRHSQRLTNYSSRHDSVLAVSNVKRAGVAPRVGRIGLPAEIPPRAINVDCTEYWAASGHQSVHSWFFGDAVIARDIVDTMNGVDRMVMVTRRTLTENRYELIKPA